MLKEEEHDLLAKLKEQVSSIYGHSSMEQPFLSNSGLSSMNKLRCRLVGAYSVKDIYVLLTIPQNNSFLSF